MWWPTVHCTFFLPAPANLIVKKKKPRVLLSAGREKVIAKRQKLKTAGIKSAFRASRGGAQIDELKSRGRRSTTYQAIAKVLSEKEARRLTVPLELGLKFVCVYAVIISVSGQLLYYYSRTELTGPGWFDLWQGRKKFLWWDFLDFR